MSLGRHWLARNSPAAKSGNGMLWKGEPSEPSEPMEPSGVLSGELSGDVSAQPSGKILSGGSSGSGVTTDTGGGGWQVSVTGGGGGGDGASCLMPSSWSSFRLRPLLLLLLPPAPPPLLAVMRSLRFSFCRVSALIVLRLVLAAILTSWTAHSAHAHRVEPIDANPAVHSGATACAATAQVKRV